MTHRRQPARHRGCDDPGFEVRRNPCPPRRSRPRRRRPGRFRRSLSRPRLLPPCRRPRAPARDRPAGTRGAARRAARRGHAAGPARHRHLRGAGRCAAGSTAPKVIAFCTDGTRMGGAMGHEGCRHIVDAIDIGRARAHPGDRPVALRRRAAGRGRRGAGRRRLGVRRDRPGVRPGPADLRRARRGRRRCRLRAGADRHRDHGAGGPGLRHRAGCGQVRDRRAGRHGGARRARRRTAASPAWCTSWPTSEDDALLRARKVDARCSPGPASPGSRACPTTRALARSACRSSGSRAYDVQPLIDGILDEPMEELQAKWAPNIVDRPRPARRPVGRRGRQQPAAARRLPGLDLGREGVPVRPDVRRVRHPAAGDRRRARLPAGRRPGVGRRGPARREAAARVRRGRGPAGDAGDPQGLRRRLHRDELQGARRDRRLRLAGRARSP